MKSFVCFVVEIMADEADEMDAEVEVWDRGDSRIMRLDESCLPINNNYLY